MANVVHYLWSKNDQSALIMPGNVPLDFAPVHAELAKYFKGNWDSIINSEVDGEESKPYELDGNNPRFGRLNAARKISRTIFMGTAPGSRRNEMSGIDESEIRLGTIQPQDLNSVAVFNDALTKLKANLYIFTRRIRAFGLASIQLSANLLTINAGNFRTTILSLRLNSNFAYGVRHQD